MAANNENADRRVVPRWRTFREALATDELSSHVIAKTQKIEGDSFLKEKEDQWSHNKELPFAIDLVSASTVIGYSEVARTAATFILESSIPASQSAQNLARNLLGIDAVEEPKFEQHTHLQIVQDVKKLKARRLSQPLNAFVWLDLARLYTLLGQIKSAFQAIRIALALAPTERFVVRCATRFYLHNHKPEIALRLLRSNPRTPTDPWLIAAEIAVSSIVEKSPRFTTIGRALVNNDNISSFHKSELASSLASLEMFSGSNRKANRLFATSLKQPTENALAQAAWASKRTGLKDINHHLFEAQNAIEARAISAANQGEWQIALENAKAWVVSESFSARPRLVASAIASTMLGEFQQAESIAKEGLITNPNHPTLINNIAFALVGQAKLDEAKNWLEKVDHRLATPRDLICLVATAGLVSFRSGNVEEGQKFYEAAIEAAIKQGIYDLKILAKLYLARERILQGVTEAAQEFQKAFDEAQHLKTTSLPEIAHHIQKQLFETRINDKPSLFINSDPQLFLNPQNFLNRNS